MVGKIIYRGLKENDSIVLRSLGRDTLFSIKDIRGQGGSCIAYTVEFEENGTPHKGVLKEFFPAFLVDTNFVRTKREIDVPTHHRARFEEEKTAFEDTYRNINQYLTKNSRAANYHPTFLGLYYGNGTVYSLVAYTHGESMEKYRPQSFAALLKVILSVSKGVAQYHDAGYLHLDIKPKNILILDGVTDLVELFDYDSFMPIKSFAERSAKTIPVPGEYYVPELETGNLRAINESTDVFELGALLFTKLFGRVPTPSDMVYNSLYDFEGLPLMKGVSPKTKHGLAALFGKSLQISGIRRYRQVKDFTAHLEKLIPLAEDTSPRLANLPVGLPSEGFAGRRKEAEELHKRLEKDGVVFVTGVEGVGKTELVKYYCKLYGNRYHTIQFYSYEDKLRSILATLKAENTEDDYSLHKDLLSARLKMLETGGDGTLLIIDGFDTDGDKRLARLLSVGESSCKLIFTGRTPVAEFPLDKTLCVQRLSAEECIKLFRFHYGHDDGIIPAIVELFDRNTLMLSLLARSAAAADKPLQSVYKELKAYSKSYKKGAYPNTALMLGAIFKVCDIKGGEKALLKELSLVTAEGVEFSVLMEGRDTLSLEKLILCGFVRINGKAVAVHPLVSELVAEDESIEKTKYYYRLAERLEALCVPRAEDGMAELTKRMALAIHLDRRYEKEADDRAVSIKLLLGRLCLKSDREKKARRILEQAEKISKTNGAERYLPYVYYYIACHEKDHDSSAEAIEYYEKARRCCSDSRLAVHSLLGVGECLAEEGDKDGAENAYTEALLKAKEEKLSGLIYKAACKLAGVCTLKRDYEGAAHHRALAENYKEYAGTETEL